LPDGNGKHPSSSNGNGKHHSPDGNGQLTSLEVFAKEWALKIKGVVRDHDPTSLMAGARLDTYEDNILHLMAKGGYRPPALEIVFKWYTTLENYSDKFVPRLYKRNDLYRKYARIRDAMKNLTGAEDQDLVVDNELLNLISMHARERYGDGDFNYRMTKRELDTVLVDMGYSKGFVRVDQQL